MPALRFALNMPGNAEIALEKRAAIITLYYGAKMAQADISRKLGLHKNTIQTIIKRVREASQSDDLDELLQHLGDKPRSGRPRRTTLKTAAVPDVESTAVQQNNAAADSADLAHRPTRPKRVRRLKARAQQPDPRLVHPAIAPSIAMVIDPSIATET